LNKKTLWVYEKIPGEVNYKFSNIKEVAKALATFHKYTKNFKFDPEQKKRYSFGWLKKDYRDIRKKLSKLKKFEGADKLAKDNVDLFELALDKIIKMNYRKKMIITHSDFGIHNLLYKGDKIIAILDFDNMHVSPRASEVSYPIKQICFNKTKDKLDKRKMNLFLKEYEKIIKLSKKEKDALLPMMVANKCAVFWWHYMQMSKNAKDRAYYMGKSINKSKIILKELGWLK